jgi:hypothetical protein
MKYSKYLDSAGKQYSLLGFVGFVACATGLANFLGTVLGATINFIGL